MTENSEWINISTKYGFWLKKKTQTTPFEITYGPRDIGRSAFFFSFFFSIAFLKPFCVDTSEYDYFLYVNVLVFYL